MFKRYLPTSLLGRTILIILVPVLLLQIAVSVVFFDRHWSKMTERLASSVAGEIAAALYKLQEDPNSLDTVRTILANYQSIDIRVDPNGTTLPEWNRFTLLDQWTKQADIIEDLSEQIGRKINYPYSIQAQLNHKQVTVSFLLDPGMGIATFTIAEGRLYSSSSYIFILWMIGLSVLFFAVALVFMRNQIRPIYRLGLIAERLGRGIPVDKIKPSGAREVRQAAEAFIRMQERINQFIEQRTTMLAAVSHDLKTPLTRMKLQAELIDKDDDRTALQNDIHDMEQMIEGYLAFARGDGDESMQKLNVRELVDQIAGDAKRLKLKVTTILTDDLASYMLWGKPQALKRLFDNIISNAAHYATAVTITVSIKNKSDCIILIEDNGPGVAAEFYPDLIKPFYRGDQSRNTKTGGVGLGLAIAHDIATSHGGRLAFSTSDSLGGLCVTVDLPL